MQNQIAMASANRTGLIINDRPTPYHLALLPASVPVFPSYSVSEATPRVVDDTLAGAELRSKRNRAGVRSKLKRLVHRTERHQVKAAIHSWMMGDEDVDVIGFEPTKVR